MWFSTLTNQPFKNHSLYSQINPSNQNLKRKKNTLSSLSSYFNLTSSYDKIIYIFFLKKWKKNEQSKNKLKLKYCHADYHPYFTYIQNYISFFSFKNRFCKHCFRSFRFGLSTFLLQSVCFSIKNSPRLLLWHLQMIFALYSPTLPTILFFIPYLQFSTHFTSEPQKVKKLEELSGSSSVLMFSWECFKNVDVL